MKPNYRLSVTDKHGILRDYAAGRNVYTIAGTYGVHHSYVSKLARRYGKPMRGGGNQHTVRAK